LTRAEFLAERPSGIGGSEIAAIMGLDDSRDAFAVYADKVGLLERVAAETNSRMAWGKRLERAIVDGYSEITGRPTEWVDETRHHPERPWQIWTPDALGVQAASDRGVDAKNVSFDQVPAWREKGEETPPTRIILQCHWYMSASGRKFWDVAALFGGNDLRIFTVDYDPDVEAALLEHAEKFWREHVLARVPPPIGCSETADRYLKQRFPKNISTVRIVTGAEAVLVNDYLVARQEFKDVEKAKDSLENEIKLAIADADGIRVAGGDITYKRCKDTVGPDWEAIAREMGATPEVIREHTRALREGSRRIHVGIK